MKYGRERLAAAVIAIPLFIAVMVVVVKPVWSVQEVKLLIYKVKDRLTPHRTVAEQRVDLFTAQPGTLVVGMGKNEIVEFVDYNCQACKRQNLVLDGLRKEGLHFRLIIRHNPIKGEKSEQAALAVIAAGKQGKAGQLHGVLMVRESALDWDDIDAIAAGLGIDTDRLEADVKTEEVKARLEADRDLAWQLRILGIPTFVTPSEVHKGLLSREQLLGLLDKDGELFLR